MFVLTGVAETTYELVVDGLIVASPVQVELVKAAPAPKVTIVFEVKL